MSVLESPAEGKLNTSRRTRSRTEKSGNSRIDQVSRPVHQAPAEAACRTAKGLRAFSPCPSYLRAEDSFPSLLGASAVEFLLTLWLEAARP
jgi:hypothetical protein